MKNIVLTQKFLVPTLLIAVIYSIAVIYAMNGSLIIDTVIGEFSLQYKISLLLALLQGMWTSMSGIGIVTLLLTAFLTGANLTLLWQHVRTIKSFKNLHVVVGGNSLFGLIGSGCAVCGLPILSLLGLSGSILYLPFRGAELSYLAVILLFISFFLLTRSNFQKQLCVVPARR